MANKKKAAKKKSLSETHSKHARVESTYPEATPISKLIFALILFLLFAVPIAMTTRAFDPFDLIKNVIFRITVFTMLFLASLDFLVFKKFKFKYHKSFLFIAGFLLFVTLSTVFSVSPWISILGKYRRYEGFITFFSYSIFLLLATHYLSEDKRRLRIAAFVAVLTGSLVSIYGIAQYFGYDYFRWGNLPFEERRSFATLGNPALLAGYLVTIFPLALGAAIFSHRRIDIFIYSLSATLTFICLITSFNRTSWLAVLLVLVCLIVILVIFWKRKAIDPRSVRNAGILIISLMLMFIALAVITQLQKSPLTVTQRIGQITEFSGGSFAHRLEIWKAGLRMIYDRPLVGLGPDTFRSTSRMYQGERYGHIAPDIVADNAHNYELQVASGVGIIGFLFFAALVVTVFFEGIILIFRRAISEAGKIHYETTYNFAGLGLNLGFFLSFLAYLFQLITSVSIIGSTFIWWFVFAAILSQSESLKKLDLSQIKPSLRSVAAIVTFSLMIFTAVFNIRLFLADTYYLQGKSMTGYPTFIKNEEEVLNKAIKLNPWQWEYRLELARACINAYRAGVVDRSYLDIGLNYALSAEAIDDNEADIKGVLFDIYNELSNLDPSYAVEANAVAAEMAEKMPHHYVGWMLLGYSHMRQAQWEKAIEAFENAIVNNPNSAHSYYYLSQCYKSLGDENKAAQYLNKALEIDPSIAQK